MPFNFDTKGMAQYSIDQAQKSVLVVPKHTNSGSAFFPVSLKSRIEHYIFRPLFLLVPNNFMGMNLNQTYTPTCGLPL
jgi:hypothetical protein